MIGLFVQVNTGTRYERGKPIGYIIQENGCWEWTGYRTPAGYGGARDPRRHRKTIAAHRLLWELSVGPIAAGMTVDHLCRNRICVNPAHMEIVTGPENTRRGGNAIKTHCPRGHPYEGRHLYRTRQNSRNCRTCHSQRRRVPGAKPRKPSLRASVELEARVVTLFQSRALSIRAIGREVGLSHTGVRRILCRTVGVVSSVDHKQLAAGDA
jgi:hypothetical protein